MAYPSYIKYKICIHVHKHSDGKIKKFDKILDKNTHRCTECNNLLRITPSSSKNSKRVRVYIE